MKPIGKSQGKGIFLFTKLSQIQVDTGWSKWYSKRAATVRGNQGGLFGCANEMGTVRAGYQRGAVKVLNGALLAVL